MLVRKLPLLKHQECPVNPTGCQVSRFSPVCVDAQLGFVVSQKSKRYQPLPEGSCVQEEVTRTFVQRIPEEELNTQGQQGAGLRPTESAFSIMRDPFDSSPQPVNQLDISRDDSSAMSSNPRQPSGPVTSLF